MSKRATELQLPLGLSLDPGRRFESYWPGPNQVVVDMLRHMASGRGEQQAFIWGGDGRGKTHLLHATCACAVEHGFNAACLSPFAADVPLSDRFQGLESLSLVCIDDLDRYEFNESVEFALFDLINRLRDSGTRLVFGAGRGPVDLPLNLADLASRVRWGPVIRLLPLDDDQTLDALRMRADLLGLQMPVEVATYMLRRFRRSMPELVGCLERLDRASMAAQRALTIPFVRQVLG